MILADEALREHRAGETLPVADDPSTETMETFLGASLHRPSATAEEMEKLRVMAETEPAIAAALRMAERGGLDIETILTIRNTES